MFPLPQNAPSDNLVCRGFSLTGDVDYESVFFGALSLLADVESYIPDETSTTTPQDVASYFAEVIFEVKNCREVGVVKWSALATDKVPDGWLLCDGSTYDQNDYPDLFDVIDPNYKSGTTFTVPDLTGRSPVGEGAASGSGGSFPIGSSYGNAERTLTISQLPPHTHSYGRLGVTGAGFPAGEIPFNLVTVNEFNATTGATGDGDPVNVFHPVHTLRAYIVS